MSKAKHSFAIDISVFLISHTIRLYSLLSTLDSVWWRKALLQVEVRSRYNKYLSNLFMSKAKHSLAIDISTFLIAKRFDYRVICPLSTQFGGEKPYYM